MAETRYVTLMASLPYHGRLFGARQTPLSRFQLNKRLAWLEPGDAHTLQEIEGILRWRRLALEESDAEFLARAHAVVDSLENPLLADIVCERLEARTVIAALRKRCAGHAAPRPDVAWGFGRWTDVISQHWNETDFSLGSVFPWVTDADTRLRNGDALGVDRLFMEHAWQQLGRRGASHYFDFAAVAIYVLRWDLVDRWTRYDADAARQRILGLANDGLGDFARMFH